MNWFNVALPVVTLIVGAAITLGANAIQHRTKRREALVDGLRAARAARYTDFLTAAHGAAHLLGRMTPNCPSPLEWDPNTYALVDSDVTQKLRVLELVGSESVVGAARPYRVALNDFRAAFDRGFVYDTPEYWDAYRPVGRARDQFIAAARAELISI